MLSLIVGLIVGFVAAVTNLSPAKKMFEPFPSPTAKINEQFASPLPTVSPSPSSEVTTTPKAIPKSSSIPLNTPTPDAYKIDYNQVKALVGLTDAVPQKPPIPESGFINGTNPEFVDNVSPEYLHTMQKAEVENLVFECQTADPDDWRVVGAHNVYTWKKYGIDYSHGDTTNWVNMLIQNPEGVYNSQREDLQKVENYYCKNGRSVLYF